MDSERRNNIYIRVTDEEQLRAAADIISRVSGCEEADGRQGFVKDGTAWTGTESICFRGLMAPADVIWKILAADARDVCTAALYIDLPDILREDRGDDTEKIKNVMALEGVCGAVIKNVDEMGLVREFSGQTGRELSLIADSFLYAYNSEAISFYRKQFPGIIFINSDELTDQESLKLQKESGKAQAADGTRPAEGTQPADGTRPEGSASQDGGFIYKLYGRQRVMFTAQSMDENYGTGRSALLESVKHDRLIAQEGSSYTTIFQEEPVNMIDKAGELPWHSYMLDFTVESPKQVRNITRQALAALGGLQEGSDDRGTQKGRTLPSNVNRGHHFKGID